MLMWSLDPVGLPKSTASGLLSLQETHSEHTLSISVKTDLRMEAQGLGMIIIQSGPYLQIANIIENGSAAMNGKLRAGDILVQIGHDNVLDSNLLELQRLLRKVAIGTDLKIMVYRDLIKLPKDCDTWDETPPETAEEATEYPPVSIDYYSSTSSEEEDEDFSPGASSEGGMGVRVFSVGIDIGYDIMLHHHNIRH
ncbi:hypothetical protein FKM82_002825 [Ascaphus truei]